MKILAYMLGFSLCLLATACQQQKQDSSENNTQKTDTTGVSSASETAPSPSVPAQEEDTEAVIAQIREQFRAVETAADKLSSLSFVLADAAPKEQLITAYFNNGQLVKISVETAVGHIWNGTHYYLKDGIPYFVFEQKTEESAVRGPFTITENRFYLHNHKVIKALLKQKEFKGDGQQVNMDDAPVKDITARDESPEGTAEAFESRCRLLCKYIESIRKLKGTWQSTDDDKSILRIDDQGWVFEYRGQAKASSDRFYANYFAYADHTYPIKIQLNGKDSGELMEYSILKQTEDSLSLTYLARGNTLTFIRKK
ncbi:hypothetical protein [Thermonema sp.]|uniref:hypothetical protein n=1 Tax=Thermonema sp. TaxID=2231181 RepID=UPI0025910F66|nr:hypothetical protein [Thermonema sp.]